MFFEFLMAMAINPQVDKMNLISQVKSQDAITQAVEIEKNKKFKKSLTQAFVFPQDNETKIYYFDEVIKKYQTFSAQVVKDFTERKDNQEEFLKWVDLPSEQLDSHFGKSHLDEIYEQAEQLKNNTNRPLVVLGIGGSKHTAEFLLNMTGVGNKGKVYFYSDIDPISFNNFLKEINHPVNELNFLVVSKSGTTFETKDSFIRFENLIADYYEDNEFLEMEAKREAQKHFAICTDKKAKPNNLREKIGLKNGEDNNYIKELYIHDGVGGRFSMFDDAGLFVLAYAGVPKEITTRILKSASEMSKKCLKTDIAENPALRSAVFSRYAEEFGFLIKQQQYFGRLFENGGENWIKQLYLESLKDFNFSATKAPDSMHYASEGFFYPQNRDKYHVVMTVMSPKISTNYEKYISAILQSYAQKVPVQIEILDIENDNIKPESIGSYIQAKHFETVYLGMLRRNSLLIKEEKLPEVFQSNVEVYKNKFKPNSPYELTPGK